MEFLERLAYNKRSRTVLLPPPGHFTTKGKLVMHNQDTEVTARFWNNVEKTDDCWNWTGYKCNGYGRLKVKRKIVRAHRFSYELLVGPIPDGLVLDHVCRNTACVNPAHLEPVTMRINVLRGVGPTAINASKTHCRNGHEFTDDNTRVLMNGVRQCRACDRISHLNNYHKNKSARRVNDADCGALDEID